MRLKPGSYYNHIITKKRLDNSLVSKFQMRSGLLYLGKCHGRCWMKDRATTLSKRFPAFVYIPPSGCFRSIPSEIIKGISLYSNFHLAGYEARSSRRAAYIIRFDVPVEELINLNVSVWSIGGQHRADFDATFSRISKRDKRYREIRTAFKGSRSPVVTSDLGIFGTNSSEELSCKGCGFIVSKLGKYFRDKPFALNDIAEHVMI